MQMSATGNSAPTRSADAGYTLVEALTTLAIVGLISGAVVLSAPGPERRTMDAAELFAARLALAADESILLNRSIALEVSSDGYGFLRLADGGWRRIETRSPLTFRRWPEGVEHYVEVQSGDAVGAESGRVVRFDPFGGATPARILLSGGGARIYVEVDEQGRAHVWSDD